MPSAALPAAADAPAAAGARSVEEPATATGTQAPVPYRVALRDFTIRTGLPAVCQARTGPAGTARTGRTPFGGVHGKPTRPRPNELPGTSAAFDKDTTELSRRFTARLQSP
ncbi:hypothetical protein [Streptomyces sp. DSM 40750]|uniref:hypothetical protein n=1 Tax=Streptomyces sp. DSM 40750 TaxID=2801030 RepID=UPI00214A937C|nr:hypothetical protein [Streptomyces sp. DSM 40750]UUU26892.1 hypothetical protein JIX55_45445 [Streptomyces sp. DSM 40750]